MSRTQNQLQKPRTDVGATPLKLSFACDAPWESMTGDERTKFCATCQRSIPNLSLMGKADRAALLEKLKTERVCGAFYMRLSGGMVTPERPLTPREKSRVKQFGLAALSASALTVATRCVAPTANTAETTRKTSLEYSTACGPVANSGDEEEVILMVGTYVDYSQPLEFRGPAPKR